MAEEKRETREGRDPELIVPSERRAYPRIALSTSVMYSVMGDKEGIKEAVREMFHAGKKNIDENRAKTTQSENISSGGILINTDEELKPGTKLHMSVHLPMPGIACNCSIIGEVVRCDEREEAGYSVAVRFIEVVHHNLSKYKFTEIEELLKVEGPEMKVE